MNDLKKNLLIALISGIAVLFATNLLFSEIINMALSRATEVGKIDVELKMQRDKLDKLIENARNIEDELIGLQAQATSHATSSVQLKATIDELATELSGESNEEAGKKLEAIRSLVSEMNEGSASDLMVTLETKLETINERVNRQGVFTVDKFKGAGVMVERDGSDKRFYSSKSCKIGEITAVEIESASRSKNQAAICGCYNRSTANKTGRGWYCWD